MKPSRQDYLLTAAKHLEVVRTHRAVVDAKRHQIRHINRQTAVFEWCLEADLFTFGQRDSMARAVKQLDGMREKAIAEIPLFERKAESALLKARELQHMASRRTLADVLCDWFWPLEIIRAIRS
jgi:hypothetical protein